MAHSLSQTLTVSSAVGSGPVYVTERVAVFVRARSNHQVPADHRRLHAARAVRNRQGQTAQSLSLPDTVLCEKRWVLKVLRRRWDMMLPNNVFNVFP